MVSSIGSDHDTSKESGIITDQIDQNLRLSTANFLGDEQIAQYWQEARMRLTGSPLPTSLNMGFLCTDRQVLHLKGSKIALRWIGNEGETENITYGDLTAKSNSFAHVLDRLGVKRGDTVFSLLGRIPELYVACLGALKFEAVFCPLFSAFGPDPIRTRMNLGQARVLITTGRLYEKKFGFSFDLLKKEISTLSHLIIIDPEDLIPERRAATWLKTGLQKMRQGEKYVSAHDYHALMLDAPTLLDAPSTGQNTPALIHFTSGTTGAPKGAVHVHEAVVCHHETAHTGLGLTADDIYWCTADPGWVTGTSYGIFAPLTVGATVIVTERDFEPDFWYQTLQDEHISVWYTAPTALRMLIKAGDEKPKSYDLSSIRQIASVGEPLNAEVVHWGRRVLGKDIRDTWWQTETGCIMIANDPHEPASPGLMGRPLPGVVAAVVKADTGGLPTENPIFVSDPEEEGELALAVGWPSLFKTYLGDATRYDACFRGAWYLTGDLVKRDANGFYRFVGRRDDVIKSSGHLIGPFEIESVLLEHAGIAEAAVIGKPDSTLGEVIKAFLSLKEGYTPSESLRRSVIAHARERLGAAVAPREVAFVDSLPKTRSGKVMRRLLKARELGLPEGDTSTLENM